jgi:hypothetical protein
MTSCNDACFHDTVPVSSCCLKEWLVYYFILAVSLNKTVGSLLCDLILYICCSAVLNFIMFIICNNVMTSAGLSQQHTCYGLDSVSSDYVFIISFSRSFSTERYAKWPVK